MTSLSLIESLSPNFDDRSEAADMIVLHYTGMETGEAALKRLCSQKAGVSAHYLVEEDGRIFILVPEEKRAFHAGISHWQGRDNVNGCSIGIEIVNPGHEFGYRPFPEAQIEAVTKLLADICQRRAVPLTRIVGHSDVAPERKEDPGEKFPWDRLATAGLAIGAAPADFQPGEMPDYETCLLTLKDIGYRVEGRFHAAPVLAFQRRFCPDALGQGLDRRTRAALAWAARAFAS